MLIDCRDDAGRHKSRPPLSSDDGKESDQDADIAGEDLFREKAKIDGYSERGQPPEQSEITQASYGSNYATHGGPLKNVYGDEVVDAADPDLHEMLSHTRGNPDATYAQHGMTTGASGDRTAGEIKDSSHPVYDKKQSTSLGTVGLAPILSANPDADATGVHRISQDVRPDRTPIRNMENAVVAVTYNEEGNPVESLHGVARLADHVNEATATAVSDNVLSEFPLRKEQGRKVGKYCTTHDSPSSCARAAYTS